MTAARHPALAWLCALAILVICWLPSDRTPVREEDAPVANFDKLIHFGMFAAFAALCRWTGTLGGQAGRIAVVGVGLAILSELGQTVPAINRNANVPDVLADVAGLLAGIAVATPIRRAAPAPHAALVDSIPPT